MYTVLHNSGEESEPHDERPAPHVLTILKPRSKIYVSVVMLFLITGPEVLDNIHAVLLHLGTLLSTQHRKSGYCVSFSQESPRV